MDIRNKCRQPLNIKRFTINAIASAILILNAEGASAVSCDSQIMGTALAGMVCDFDSGSGITSVTVKNGGEVGGINMISYNPTSPSYIAINAGGIISNNTGVGIAISSSLLSNGLSNSGTISNTNGSGIVISNTSTINGGLSNSGLISANNADIAIYHSNINGGIYNNGTISSTTGTGVRISSSTINGGISNSGTIKGGGVDEGIAIINHSTVADGIMNSGLLEVSSGNGILMNGSSTINGGISNSGIIRSALHSGIAIFNLSNIQGDILNSGTISGMDRGMSIHNASSLSGNIFNSGTISGGNNGIAIYSETTVSGKISNSGTISANNTGIAVTSSSTISGGIANSGTIRGDVNALYIDPSSHVSQIDILGQHARMIGAVDAMNTTVNIHSGAVFTSEGTFNVNNFNIDSNAVFNMAQAMTVQNTVNNAGTLVIGNTTQTITGNYTQNSGGVLQVGASSATNYGQLVVNGAVNLSQSGNIYVQIAPNSLFHAGDVLSNVMSGNTLVTPTHGFNVSDNSFIWAFTATDPGSVGVSLTATIDPAVNDVCHGDYCYGAATTIVGQVAAGNPEFTPYALLTTESEFKTAASQATPELTNENMQVIQLITKAVMDSVPMWSMLHGTGDAMRYQSGTVWLKPYGASMIQDEKDTVEGFNAKAYGVVIGKDIQVSEDVLFGGAFSAGGDNMHGRSVLNGQSIHSNTYQGLIYGAKKLPHHLYLAGQGLIGYGDNDTERSIPLYASTTEGSYNSWFTNIRAQLGWNINALGQDLLITPALDASYLFINQDSYHESGSPMDLAVDSNNNSSLVLGAYGFGAYRLTTLNNQQDLTLTGYAGIARNVLNSQPEATATFVAGGPSFSTNGIPFNELVFRGGMGLLLANPTKPLRVNLNYDLQSGNNAYSGVGTLTVTYRV